MHFYDRDGHRRPARTPWIDREPSRVTTIAALVLVPLALAATGDGATEGVALTDIAAWAAMAAWWCFLGACLLALAVIVVVWLAGLHLEDRDR